MDMEYTIIKHKMKYMKVIGKKEKNRDKEYIFLLLVINIRDYGIKIKNMVMVD